ncbi:hypothetical protein Tco_1525223 [Tanacetum coccineum]
MSTNEQTPLSQPTSVVRNTLGNEQVPQDVGRLTSDEALREYCDKNYYNILPIIAEKVHQEKVQQEKLKAVKAYLNFEETSQHSESGTPSRRRDLKERLGPRRVCSMFGSLEPKRGRSELGDKGKSNSHLRNIITKEHPLKEWKHCQKVKVAQEDIRSRNQRGKSQALRTIYPSHGHIKTYDGSEDPEDYLKIFQAAAKTECWAMPTCYDDLKKAFLENYLQQKKCIKDPVEIHNIKKRDRESTEEFVQSKKPDKSKTLRRGASEINKDQSGSRTGKGSKKGENLKKRQAARDIDGEEDGMEGPMIIKAELGGHCVHRIYVDGGSSSEILYEHCFNRFFPEIGDEEHSTSTWMSFMMVRSPSPYNRIIGRPGVRRIWAVPSTAHGMLKFPVTCETVTLRSSRIIPLECTMVSGPGVPRPVINQVTEEKIHVEIHPGYPEQTIAIGSTLTEEGWKEMYGLLRRNIDIFA